MSSVRINAVKPEGSPSAAAAQRAGGSVAPATGFAAALANFSSHSHHSSDGSGDAQAGDDHAAAARGKAGSSVDEAAPSNAAVAKLPPALAGIAGWLAAADEPGGDDAAPPAGTHGAAKPGAAATDGAAATIAASLATPATQPTAGAPFDAKAAGAQTSSSPALDGATVAATSVDTSPGGDPTAVGQPGIPGDSTANAAVDPGLHDAAASASGAGTLAAPSLTQAAASPVHTAQFDVAALATIAPAAAAALIAPVAASAGGSGTHDFADTGRDGAASAAAALSGVATAGAAGAPSGVDGPTPGTAASPSTGPAGDAGAANVATQLSGQVLRLLTNSGQEATVRLNPPDLGEVTVRVAVSGRDVTAWFGSPQPTVQQTISLGLGQLQADLGNAGYSLGNAWVGADTSGFGSRGDTAPPPAAFTTAAAAAPALPAAARLSSNSGVSIYV